MSHQDSILFLIGTALAEDRPDDYLVQPDPTPSIVDVRGSARPPQPEERVDGDPVQSWRIRGPHLPTVFENGRAEAGVGAVEASTIEDPVTDPRMQTIDDRAGPASNRVAVQERILSRNRIRDLARSLVRYRSVGIVNSAFHPPVSACAVDMDRERDELGWDLGSSQVQPPFVIEVAGYNSVYQFPVETAERRGGLLFAPVPAEVVRLRRRWARRITAPPGCTIDLHLADGTTVLRRRVLRDVSFTGLSFWSAPEEYPLHNKTEVAFVDVYLPGQAEPVRCSGSIRFVAASGTAGDLCGMRLERFDPAGDATWRKFVSRLLYPTTRNGEGLHPAVWDLYHRAGYFHLSGKTPEAFNKLEQSFQRNARCIDAHPEVGCLVAWPVDEGKAAFATIMMLKIYANSWFGCHMAKVPGDAPSGASGRQVLRDMHLHAYEHIQLDPDLKWVIGYPQVKQVWSRSVHHDMPRRYTNAGLACIVRFRALEIQADAQLPDPPPGMEIGTATSDEIALLLHQFASNRPRAYMEAYDLTADRLDLRANKRLWNAAGMPRDREVRVARVHGQPVAAAVLESAAEGLHLYGLLDVVRPFPLVEDLAVATPAMEALLRSARDWYRGHRRDAFTSFIEDDRWIGPATMGRVSDMGLADMTILSAQLLPELLEHLIEVTAPKTMPSVPAVRKPSAP